MDTLPVTSSVLLALASLLALAFFTNVAVIQAYLSACLIGITTFLLIRTSARRLLIHHENR